MAFELIAERKKTNNRILVSTTINNNNNNNQQKPQKIQPHPTKCNKFVRFWSVQLVVGYLPDFVVSIASWAKQAKENIHACINM